MQMMRMQFIKHMQMSAMYAVNESFKSYGGGIKAYLLKIIVLPWRDAGAVEMKPFCTPKALPTHATESLHTGTYI